MVKHGKNKAIFLDRDGVINKEVNYLFKVEDFEFTRDCIKALLKLQSEGFLLFIITNQSGIGRGYYTEQDYEELTRWMLAKFIKNGVNISKVSYCPHHENYGKGKFKKICNCRKPNPGMITSIIDSFNIDVSRSILIGDKLSDIEAGKSANINKLVLVKSGAELPKKIPGFVDVVRENLSEFAFNSKA